MDTQTKPTPVHYETTWNKQPKAPKISRRKSTAPAGSIVRLALGTVVTVGAVYASIYTVMLLTIGSIGAAFGAGDPTGMELVGISALMLAGGVVMISTRWSRSGGIVAGVLLLWDSLAGAVAEDETGLAAILAMACCVAGVVSIFVACVWGGTGSRI